MPVPFEMQVLYKFRVDDTTWITDPTNPTTVPDGQGGEKGLQLQAHGLSRLG